MHCTECDSKELLGVVIIEKVLPLTQKGGSVIVAGEKVTQKDIKDTWDKAHDGEGDRYVRGPIICADCETEHVYLKGASASLRRLKYEDVRRMSVEDILDMVDGPETGDGEDDHDDD